MNKLEAKKKDHSDKMSKYIELSEELDNSLNESGAILANLIRLVETIDHKEGTLSDVASVQKSVRSTHDYLDNLKKVMYALHEKYAKSITPECMEREEITSAKLEGVGTLSLRDDIYLKQLNKEDLAEWLTDIGHDDLVTETVNSSSLKSLIKKLLISGEEIPDCVEITPYSNAVILK